MNKTKFYKLTTWGLLLLNVAVLAFFILTKPKPHHLDSRGKNFSAEVTDILNLNDQQTSSFRKLASEHHQNMKRIQEQQQKLLEGYFESIANTSLGENKEIATTQLQQLERQKLEVTYQHLIDIKDLLNDDQDAHFQEFIKTFMVKIIKKGKKGPHPPKDMR